MGVAKAFRNSRRKLSPRRFRYFPPTPQDFYISILLCITTSNKSRTVFVPARVFSFAILSAHKKGEEEGNSILHKIYFRRKRVEENIYPTRWKIYRWGRNIFNGIVWKASIMYLPCLVSRGGRLCRNAQIGKMSQPFRP